MNTTASGTGQTVAQFPIERIVLGRSYRRELGDLADLTTSIQTLGLLCPIVITSDGVLISGRRRLEVMRQLGHATVPVWIASEVSDKLRTLLAIQDDNLLHKHFTTTEKAALYAEYKTLLAEENARRQAATRFGAAALPGSDDGEADDSDPEEKEVMIVATYQGSDSGRWDSQPPAKRKSRVQAATAVTGRDSSQQLEQVLALERLATNEDEDERVRRAAAEAVVEINGDAKVHGRYHEVIALRGVCWLEKTAVNESATAAVREAADDELRAVRQIDRPVERSRAVAAAIARRPSAGYLYTDEDKIDDTGRRFDPQHTIIIAQFSKDDPAPLAYLGTDHQVITTQPDNGERLFHQRAGGSVAFIPMRK